MSTNVNVDIGLYNSSEGTVEGFIWDDKNEIESIIVDLKNYRGPVFDPERPTLVPIPKHTFDDFNSTGYKII